jgi:2-polyprenyl-3-methyl-5-hydroxy-6-metoxy-1,4-benzoquinol methylase
MAEGHDDDGWDEWAAGWDDEPDARAYSRAAYQSLVTDLVGRGIALDGMAVLDFGCGTGLLTEQLVGQVARIDAMDTAPKMIDVLDAKVRAHRWTTVTTSTSVDATSPTYDLVVSSSVCSFLDDYPSTVADLVALLRPGGVFVQWDWEADPAEADSHGFTPAQIRDALTAVGLTNVDVRTGFSIPMGDESMEPLMGSGQRT